MITIGIPTRGNPHLDFQLSLGGLEPRDNLFVDFEIGESIVVARNLIAKRFLASDHTHLFWLDDDCYPHPECVNRLLAMDCDIASGVTPIKLQGKFYWNIGQGTEWFSALDDYEQYCDIDICGGSGILVKRKVYESLPYPWYIWQTTDDGVQIGEDITFAKECRAKGFTMRADTTVIFDHCKTLSLMEIICTLRKQYKSV